MPALPSVTEFARINRCHSVWANGVILSALTVGVLGCSGRPADIVAPDIDVAAATKAAFELYDTNQDGQLSEQELVACPGVLGALTVYDGDRNKQVSTNEMRDRIAAWATSSSPMMTVDCIVTLDGRPLRDALVKYVPEKYLAAFLPPAAGTTGSDGTAVIAIAPEHLSDDHKRVQAVNPGVYKIEISHPSKKIPEKYNERTTLGREVSRQTRAVPSERFELSSR